MARLNLKLLVFSLVTGAFVLFVFLFSNNQSETVTEKLVNPALIDNNIITNTKPPQTETTTSRGLNKYFDQYSALLNCKHKALPKWSANTSSDPSYDYLKAAPVETHEERILRGILVYFPIESTSHFKAEFKWLHRTWVEMIKQEPLKWRTDLILFAEKDDKYLKNDGAFFQDLGCSYDNRRKSGEEKPKCILIDFKSLKKRTNIKGNTIQNKEDFLLNKLNIFNKSEENLAPFYSYIYGNLKDYGYTDSILMAFDGYNYFEEAGYDYLMRSDMDVFISPFAGKWLPRYCNDFIVGSGGFSEDFNNKRLGRVANDLGLEYAYVKNLGSTWYSTPEQFRLVSYLTLVGMSYLSQYEFSEPEREGKVGGVLWPYWHFGVLLLYGQSIGLNHLIASKQLNVVKLERYIDYGSGNVESIMDKIHIHVYHGEDLFSKSSFKAGKFDNMVVSDEDSLKVKYFCLKMALESRNSTNVYKMFLDEINKKI